MEVFHEVETHYFSNSIHKVVYQFWLSLRVFGSVKENPRALIDDNECQIVGRANFILASSLEAQAKTLMYGRWIWSVFAPSPREAGNNCICEINQQPV